MSGEDFGPNGFLFPTGSEVAITDGWELRFSHILVTVGKITLSENPDKAPSDQSQVDQVVAEAAGPWAVDLHKEGTVSAAGGEGMATPITTISKQNKNGDAAFVSDLKYAFGYDILAATASAERVNFKDDAEAEALYQEMISNGVSVLYVGNATFKGGTSCTASTGSAYDFTAIPESVPFKLAFQTPVSNINCQNQENQGEAFAGEEFPRGIPIKSNTASIAQITFHLDHPLFSDVAHDSPLYFDQIAAQAVGAPAGTSVTLDDLVGLDPTAFVDGAGAALPWRVCDGSTPLPSGTQRAFGIGSLALDPTGDPAQALRDYHDYIQYVQSTQGHLNGGEGLCYVQRNYPSPP
jgi:hypothetical protein